MAAPKLSIRPWDISQSLNGNGQVDLSALTGYSYLQGADGSDFYIPRSVANDNVTAANVSISEYYAKTLGGLQLRPTFFCDDPNALYHAYNSGDLTCTWNPNDQTGRNGDVSYSGSKACVFDSPRDWGIRVTGIVAKRGEERTAVFLWNAQRTIISTKATISDSSSPPAFLPTIVASTSGQRHCFAVTYTPGPDADAVVTVECRVIGINPAQSYDPVLVGPNASYIQVPRQLPSPRAYRHYLRSHGV